MKRPEDDFENVYDLLEHAIDYAFEGKMTLKFYDLLKYRKTTKVEVEAFLHSSTAQEIGNLVLDLQEYLKGGKDNEGKDRRNQTNPRVAAAFRKAKEGGKECPFYQSNSCRFGDKC